MPNEICSTRQLHGVTWNQNTCKSIATQITSIDETNMLCPFDLGSAYKAECLITISVDASQA